MEAIIGLGTTFELDLIAEASSLALPLEHAPAYLRAEIVHACTHEGALHLEDIFDTRTRLTWEQARHGLDAVEEIADLAAEALGWDDRRRGAEVELFDVPLGSVVSLVSCSGRSCTGGGSEGAAATRKPSSTSSGTHSSATSSRPSRPISRPVPMAVDPTDGA